MDTELQEFITLLDGVKSGVGEFISDIGDEGVRWSANVPDTNSAAVLVTHMFGSEAEAIQEFVGGYTVNRDRDLEFANPLSTVQELLELIYRVGARTRDVLSRETREGLGRPVGTRQPGPNEDGAQLADWSADASGRARRSHAVNGTAQAGPAGLTQAEFSVTDWFESQHMSESSGRKKSKEQQ